MTVSPIANADTFTFAQGASVSTVSGNLGADNGGGVDYDPDGSILGFAAGTVLSLAGDGDRFLGAWFDGNVLSFLTIQGTVTYPHPVIVTTAALTTAEGGLVMMDTSGNFTYTSALNFSGLDSFTYTLVDADFNLTTTSVTLNVTPTAGANGRPVAATDQGLVTPVILPVNGAPLARDDAFRTTHGRNVAGNVLADNGAGADSDADGDVLTVDAGAWTTTAGGTVTMAADGSFAYQPRSGFVGTDSFSYTLRDPTGASDLGLVTLEVVNRAPVAVTDSYAVTYRGTVTGNLLQNDSDPDGDAMSVTPGRYVTAKGSVVTVAADGSFSFTAGDLAVGAEQMTYRLTDTLGAVSTGSILVTVGGHSGYRGTAEDDTWTGTSADNVAMMGGGDDWADGGDGRDILDGGADDDMLYGGLGNDRLYGQAGKDELFGGAGVDWLDGGAGDDRLRGGAGADLFSLDIDPADTDRIGDFAAIDRLLFDAVDLGLSAGGLPDASWLVAAGAPDGSHGRFVYNAASRSLAWDHDGLAATAAQVVVTFDSRVTLTHESFLLV